MTGIQFPYIDPIGTMLVSFDNGVIKVWQSVVKNEQLMKILELKQAIERKAPGPVHYDISQVGYQQFDLIDCYDLLENPNDLEELDEVDRQNLKELYGVSIFHFISYLVGLGQEIPQHSRTVCPRENS